MQNDQIVFSYNRIGLKMNKQKINIPVSLLPLCPSHSHPCILPSKAIFISV